MMQAPAFMVEQREPTLPEFISFLRAQENEIDTHLWPVIRNGIARSYGLAGVCLVMALSNVPFLLQPFTWATWFTIGALLINGGGTVYILWDAQRRFNQFMQMRLALARMLHAVQSAYSNPAIDWRAMFTKATDDRSSENRPPQQVAD